MNTTLINQTLVNATGDLTQNVLNTTILGQNWLFPLIWTIAFVLAITRDWEKMKEVALPVSILLLINGVKISVVQIILLTIVFVIQCLSIETAGNLLKKIEIMPSKMLQYGQKVRYGSKMADYLEKSRRMRKAGMERFAATKSKQLYTKDKLTGEKRLLTTAELVGKIKEAKRIKDKDDVFLETTGKALGKRLKERKKEAQLYEDTFGRIAKKKEELSDKQLKGMLEYLRLKDISQKEQMGEWKKYGKEKEILAEKQLKGWDDFARRKFESQKQLAESMNMNIANMMKQKQELSDKVSKDMLNYFNLKKKEGKKIRKGMHWYASEKRKFQEDFFGGK